LNLQTHPQTDHEKIIGKVTFVDGKIGFFTLSHNVLDWYICDTLDSEPSTEKVQYYSVLAEGKDILQNIQKGGNVYDHIRSTISGATGKE
jgi:hypothetical protein